MTSHAAVLSGLPWTIDVTPGLVCIAATGVVAGPLMDAVPASRTVLVPLTAVAAAVTLKAPLTFPQRHVSTMIASTLAWMVPAKAMSLMVAGSRVSMLTAVGSTLATGFPVVPSTVALPAWTRDPIGRCRAVALRAGAIAVRWASKSVATYVILSMAKATSSLPAGPVAVSGGTIPRSVVLYGLWAAQVAVMASSEMNELIVWVGSGGAYELLPFNDWFLASKSLYEFWSARYNRHVSKFFRDILYRPLRDSAHWTPAAASLAVFAASGAMHAYSSAATFGAGEGSSFVFFAVSGLLVSLERWLDANVPVFADRPGWVARLCTWAPLAALAPLYPGLFVASWPEWFVHNPIVLPPSVLGTVAQSIVSLLGYQQP